MLGRGGEGEKFNGTQQTDPHSILLRKIKEKKSTVHSDEKLTFYTNGFTYKNSRDVNSQSLLIQTFPIPSLF